VGGIGSRRVYVADGNAYFNRPGPRIVESLEILALQRTPRRSAIRQQARQVLVRLGPDFVAMR